MFFTLNVNVNSFKLKKKIFVILVVSFSLLTFKSLREFGEFEFFLVIISINLIKTPSDRQCQVIKVKVCTVGGFHSRN